MKAMTLSTAAALALALALLGCGGGDDDGNNTDVDAAPACMLPTGGQCDGNTAQRCDGDQVVGEDCGLATCTSSGGGVACVDECEAAGVSGATCVGDAVRSCETVGGRHVVVTESCGIDQTCTGTPATCVGDPCSGIGPLGRCEGDTLVRCSGGVSTPTDCSGSAQVCGYQDSTTGYACIAPTASFVVRGVVRYEDRPPLTSGALGAIQNAAARSAEVAVVTDAGSTVLATAHTADDGSYTLRYDSTAGTMVHVMVTARSTVALRPIRVNRSQNAVHAFGGASFAAAADVTQDVLVTNASDVAEAFNILDQSVLAMDAIRLKMNATPVQLTARWSRGSNNGTFYSGNTIYLLGANSDNDGYDDTVILHEIGHFVEDTVSRSDSQGGSHDGSPTDPNLAWSEGFSTYFAMAVRGQPWYMDSNSGGGWGYNGDTTVTAASAGGGIGQDVSEDMVTECLWDLGDGGSGDDDTATAATHTDVLLVAPEYLRSATLRTVGEAGVDLVDFLDGWFLSQTLGACPGARYVVTTRRTFPYDYNGPAGACP